MRARLQLGNLGRAGVFRHGHQHLPQVDGTAAVGSLRCSGGIGLLGLAQVAVHVQFAHLHARIDLAFAQALQQQLAAQFFAKALGADAVGGQAALHFCLAHVVLLRHAALGLRDGQVVHLDAQLACGLQLRLFQNGTLQHLAQQSGARRLGAALLGNLLRDALGAHLHLVVGDRLGVDDGHDVVGRAGGCRGADSRSR